MSKAVKKYGLGTCTYLHKLVYSEEEWRKKTLEARYMTSLMNSLKMKRQWYVVTGIHVWENYRLR